MLTQERLMHHLNYDPETGLFTRLTQSSNAVKIGDVAGRPNNKGHIQIMVDGKRYLAHRLAFLYMTGEFPENMVDHKDGVKDNNRWENIRDATPGENCQNIRAPLKNNTTGYLGVHYHIVRNKYQSSIKTNGVQKHLGYFDTAEEASEAYLTAKREIHTHCTI